jgi:hypothetical protein
MGVTILDERGFEDLLAGKHSIPPTNSASAKGRKARSKKKGAGAS